ncbi:unnamed protein product, partial [Mesorhabditis spiculigera]
MINYHFTVGYCFCGAHGPVDADYGALACDRCKKLFRNACDAVKNWGPGCRNGCKPSHPCSYHNLLRLERLGMRADFIPKRK